MMKKMVVMAFAAMLLVWAAGSAQANFIQSLDPVSIWAVDCFDASSGSPGQDGKVILAAGSINGTLAYSLNQTDWVNFSGGTAEISNMNSCKEEVFLHFTDISGAVYDSGTLTFIGDPGSCCSLPVYNMVSIDWASGAETTLSFLSTSASGGCDKLAPVPVPPSAIMLFSGLLGLVGVRRMRKDS